MQKYNCLIFDIDNTLLNFSKSEYYSIQKIFKKYGVIFSETTFAEYSLINKALWGQLERGEIKKNTVLTERFVRFFAQHGVSVNGKQVDQEYRQYLEERVDLMDGAKEILKYAKDKGYRILAGTNGVGSTQRIRLQNAGMMSYFDALYISEEVGFEKPDVRFFETILATEQIKDVSRVLMIGDSLSSDIEGAYRVDMDSIWISLGDQEFEKRYTYKVDAVSDIDQII